MKIKIAYPFLTQQTLLVVVVAFMAVVSGMSVVRWPLSYTAVLALWPLAIVAFQHPKYLVWLALGLLFFGNRTEIPAFAFWGRYLPTVCTMGLVAVIMLRVLLRNREDLEGRPIIYAYALFAWLLLISAIYNGTGARNIVLGLVTNLRYPLFFFALLNAGFSPDFYRRVLKAFVALTLLQIPITVAQFASGFSGDSLTGTMGSNVPLISVILGSQCALLACWFVMRKRRYLFATLVLLVPVLLANIQIGLIFLPLLAIFISFRYYGVRWLLPSIRFGFLIGVLGIGLIIGTMTVLPSVNKFFSQALSAYLHIDYYTNPIHASSSSIGRLTILRYSWPLLLEEPLRIIWGFGPEASQGGLITGSYLTSNINMNALSGQGIVCQKLLLEEGLRCREPQSFKSLMEYGFLGTLLYLVPLFMIWRQEGSQFQPYLHSAERRILWLFFQGICFFYIFLGFWYVGVWRIDSYSFLFWVLAAAVKVERKAAALPKP